MCYMYEYLGIITTATQAVKHLRVDYNFKTFYVIMIIQSK